ncbi:hypothetical protein ACFQRL_07980 [Microbacterium fluvii]|uniref:Uncharacterized protein n=1 Tax=Microbacterium fluvii TaxID=415215 RepID=A0ABW2HGP0_9MICO|nr:hypothetical protein [Microbacterium fluvii]MCU4672524.1 hypothetical protein [Microbacterium fluvii]
MSTLTIRALQSAPELTRNRTVRLAAAGPQLWRVLGPDARVIGHLHRLAHADGTRFRARRFHEGARAFLDLGDFWSADDAVDCLRLTR